MLTSNDPHTYLLRHIRVAYEHVLHFDKDWKIPDNIERHPLMPYYNGWPSCEADDALSCDYVRSYYSSIGYDFDVDSLIAWVNDVLAQNTYETALAVLFRSPGLLPPSPSETSELCDDQPLESSPLVTETHETGVELLADPETSGSINKEQLQEKRVEHGKMKKQNLPPKSKEEVDASKPATREPKKTRKRHAKRGAKHRKTQSVSAGGPDTDKGPKTQKPAG